MSILLFALAQALDAMTTHIGITRMGAQEIMGPASWLISQGWDVFLVAKLLTALWIVPAYAFVAHNFTPRDRRRILTIAVSAAWLPVVGNMAQIILFGG